MRMQRPTRRASLKLLALMALAVLTLSPHLAHGQPYPVGARFGRLCIVPRTTGVILIPFTGAEIRVDAPLADVLATFPMMYQGRARLGVGMVARDPGLILRFAMPSFMSELGESYSSEFNPPPPWPLPLDSVAVNWEPQPGISLFSDI